MEATESTPLLRGGDTQVARPASDERINDTLVKRLRGHLLRFWWAYLLVVTASALAIVVPVIYVYYPQQAQRDVDASQIKVTAQSIRNPSPNSFDYGNTAVLETASAHSPRLLAWNGSYYLPGAVRPFLSVTVPEARAHNGTIIEIAQHAHVSSPDEFAKSTDIIFSSQDFSIYLRGTGGLKESILPTINVEFNKKLDLVGLNKLRGLQISEFHLFPSGVPTGVNAAGNVTIPNPSVFTLEMGNVTLDLSVNGSSIGNATLPNFTLRPGNHSYLLYVNSNQPRVVELLRLPAYQCGLLPVQVEGRTSTFDGQVIPYFTKPLRKYPLLTTLDLVPAFEEAGLGSLINGKPCV